MKNFLSASLLVILGTALTYGQVNQNHQELLDLEAKVAAQTALLNTAHADIIGLDNADKSMTLSLNALQGALDAQTGKIGPMTTKMNAVVAKTNSIVASPGHMRFEAVNLYIRHSANANAAANGLGNLIIGPNTLEAGVERTGSLNLVIGPYHSYTGKSNLIAGWRNGMRGTNSAILSGTLNEVMSYTEFGLIGTGYNNTVWGDMNTILTGDDSQASGSRNLLLTGTSNAVLNDLGSTIITGYDNVASKSGALVMTGRVVANYGICSAIGSGDGGALYEDYAWVDFE